MHLDTYVNVDQCPDTHQTSEDSLGHSLDVSGFNASKCDREQTRLQIKTIVHKTHTQKTCAYTCHMGPSVCFCIMPFTSEDTRNLEERT